MTRAEFRFQRGIALRKLQVTWIFKLAALVLLLGRLIYGMPVDPAQKAGLAPSPKPERKANRTLPRVEPPRAEPSFSANPTDAEIFRARVFDEPLVPMPSEVSPQDNAALADAIRRYLRRSENDDTSAIEAFLHESQNSKWRASLLTDLGLAYRRTGYFTKAVSAWQEAWTLSKDVTESNGRAIADRAVAELAQLISRLGRIQDLEVLLAEVDGRDVRGAASEKLQG